jgi:hypothetical protein
MQKGDKGSSSKKDIKKALQLKQVKNRRKRLNQSNRNLLHKVLTLVVAGSFINEWHFLKFKTTRSVQRSHIKWQITPPLLHTLPPKGFTDKRPRNRRGSFIGRDNG